MASVFGTLGSDYLVGSAVNDTISGWPSQGSPDSEFGNDELFGFDGDDRLSGGGGNDTLHGGAGSDTLDGGAGVDTAEYSNALSYDVYAPNGVQISLVSGHSSDGDSLIGIENIDGSPSSDDLQGNFADNHLVGNAGNDTIWGDPTLPNDGNDTLEGNDGDDVLTSFSGSDLLIGGLGHDTLSAFYSPGDQASHFDTLWGGSGNDVLRYGVSLDGSDGDDKLYAGSQGSIMHGGPGNDLLQSGASADTLDGGDGFDHASYALATGAVHVSLLTGSGHGSDAEGDILTGVEALDGSSYADLLTGDDQNNSFTGGRGADTIDGRGGNDLVDYSGSAAGIRVWLAGHVALGGDADHDSLAGIENLHGSNYGDTLAGDAGANSIDGDRGADALSGGLGDDTLRGGSGADTLDGGSGLDTADYATSSAAVRIWLASHVALGGDATGDSLTGIENLHGSDCADTLAGDSGQNEIVGAAGNDSLCGGLGNDTLHGGPGVDTLDGGSGLDTADYSDLYSEYGGYPIEGVEIDLSSGSDSKGDCLIGIENVIGSVGDDRITGDAGNNTINGGEGSDILFWTGGADLLVGGAGDDSLVSLDNLNDPAAPHDTLLGGDGNDMIEGGTSVSGGDGNDQVFASDRGSTIDGGAGNDFISAGFVHTGLDGQPEVDPFGIAACSLTGGDGNDELSAGPGPDTLDGGDGFDFASYWLSSGPVQVSLRTGLGAGSDAAGDHLIGIEALLGSNYADILTGDERDNAIWGGPGADTIDGLGGIDLVDYSNSAAAVRVWLAGHSTAGGDAAGDILADIENVLGSNFNDTLAGDAGPNSLNGGNGADSLAGGIGIDTLQGGQGADTLDGGTGLDTADYSDSRSGISVSLATDAAIGGDAAGDSLVSIENLTGSMSSDTLIGDAGANILDAGNGADSLEGSGGADTLIGGEGIDTAGYSGSSAVSIDLARHSALGGDAAGDSLDGIENLVGSDFRDTLVGDAEANSLSGAAGDDSLRGGDNADSLAGGTGADTLDGGGGLDTADYSSSTMGVSVSLATQVGKVGDAAGDSLIGIENLIGSANPDTLIGNNGANELVGGLGADSLIGSVGADSLSGSEGNDTLTGGAGDDHFVFGPRGGQDIVTDFHHAAAFGQEQDKLDLTQFHFSFAAADIQHYATSLGGNTYINLDGDGSTHEITLLGVTHVDASDVLI